jgi:hypothetical protein
MKHSKTRFSICIEGELMANATQEFTLVVTAGAPPPPNPPVITPANADDSIAPEQEGVAVIGGPVATVTGGVPPYTYDFAGQPAGMSFNETTNPDGSASVTISGTPAPGSAAGSPYTIDMTVTDSAGAVATTKLSARKIG